VDECKKFLPMLEIFNEFGEVGAPSIYQISLLIYTYQNDNKLSDSIH
jgi:hypothetical protein